MEAIFKTYPAVKRKHEEHVRAKAKMTEQEFWTKFFQSHYYHRDHVHGHNVKDIFTECAKDDDCAIREQLKAGVGDRVADVAAFSDKTLDENYGGFDGQIASTSGVGIGGGKATSAAAASSIVSQNIIKRFNQHSIMVMKTSSEAASSSSVNNSKASENGVKNGVKKVVGNDEDKMKRLRDNITYDDLEPETPKKKSKLNLTKVERYLAGPMTSNSASSFISDSNVSLGEIQASRASLQVELANWRHNSRELMKACHATQALVDLSPGGALMQKSARRDAIAAQCPESVKRDLAALYVSLGELARHFWSSFPATTPERMEKVVKMHETLKRFRDVKLKPFENEVARNYTSIAGELTAHINQMLEAAFRKFATWKQRQQNPRASLTNNSPAKR